jgi:hypothetical protein
MAPGRRQASDGHDLRQPTYFRLNVNGVGATLQSFAALAKKDWAGTLDWWLH